MEMTDRLSGLDTSFLHLERDGTHMHVASTTLFEGPAPRYTEFRDHIESRLHLVPRFRQKLRFVPFGQGRPVWVDDPHLNLAYHIRHTSLPEPGSEQQLRVLAARIFSQQLDRSKPLWELWLIEGLKGGRFAIVGKTHHAMVDGVSGVDITTVLFDAEKKPADPPDRLERWQPAPEPSRAQLLSEALLQRAFDPREAIRGIRRVVRGPRRAFRKATEAVVAAGTFAWAGIAAPKSPINFDVGPHRRFAWVRASLGDMKQVKNELGGTVNDVILTTVAGALGRYMRKRGHPTVGLELRAMVPVSVRTKDQRGSLGNQVTTMMAPLPVWCEDPVKRMEMVRRSMGDLKQSNQAMGATLLTQLADFAPPTIAGQAARLPDGPAGQEPGRLHRDHELRRPGQLRADRRLRRHARPRRPGQGPGGIDCRADRGRRRAPGDLPSLRPAGGRRIRDGRAERPRRARGIARRLVGCGLLHVAALLDERLLHRRPLRVSPQRLVEPGMDHGLLQQRQILLTRDVVARAGLLVRVPGMRDPLGHP